MTETIRVLYSTRMVLVTWRMHTQTVYPGIRAQHAFKDHLKRPMTETIRVLLGTRTVSVTSNPYVQVTETIRAPFRTRKVLVTWTEINHILQVTETIRAALVSMPETQLGTAGG